MFGGFLVLIFSLHLSLVRLPSPLLTPTETQKEIQWTEDRVCVCVCERELKFMMKSRAYYQNPPWEMSFFFPSLFSHSVFFCISPRLALTHTYTHARCLASSTPFGRIICSECLP